MPLRYPVSPGTILLCDYSRGGFRAPEMVKRRPAIVLVGRLPRRRGLHTVVPLSTTPSDPRDDWHCRLLLETPPPPPFDAREVWVKADMIATVALDRLDLFRTARDATGRRRYLTNLKVTEAQFETVRRAVRAALGLR